MVNMEFKIKSKFKPTGDQPQAIKKLVDNVQSGIKDQILLGVTGSGKTYTIANVIQEVQKPTIILAPNKTLAAQLYNEYKNFFPDNAVEYHVSYYDYYQPEAYISQTDTYIEKDSSINDEIDKMRHSATSAILTRKDVIVVASVSAIYGLGSPQAYKEQSLLIDKKSKRSSIAKKLLKLRYERNDIAFERGKFRMKGENIDIFPAYQETAYRLSFFDEDLEEIYEIEPLTGKKLKKLEYLTIMPATHYLSNFEKESIINPIKEELKERVKFFEDKNMLVEAQRIKQRTEHDLEMISEVGYCKGIENYSRFLTGKKAGEAPYTLFDYFDGDYLVVIDESHITVPQIGGMYNGDRARKQSLVDNGFRLPSAFDNRPLTYDEFFSKIPQAIHVSATPSDKELEMSNGEITELLIRPTGIVEPEITIKPTKNQIDDLYDEIKKQVEKGYRTLVTTLTKKMAEEITEYYKSLNLKIDYMHSDIDTIERVEILRKLRLGEIDVLVGINLLREGLDLPEVGLVAILEADKEGFLRSRRSLIQTMGRAARNMDGQVILYADKETDSMKNAINEVNRRRKVQQEYNKKNNIKPKSVISKISDSLVSYNLEEEKSKKKKEYTFKSTKDIEKEISKLNKKMQEYSKEYNFEKAIECRDEINRLKKILIEIG